MTSVQNFDPTEFASKMEAFHGLTKNGFNSRSFEKIVMGRKWKLQFQGMMSQSIQEMIEYLAPHYSKLESKQLIDLNIYVSLIKSKTSKIVKNIFGTQLFVGKEVNAFHYQILTFEFRLQLELLKKKLLEIEVKLGVIPDFKQDIELIKSQILKMYNKTRKVSDFKCKLNMLEKDIQSLEGFIKRSCEHYIDNLNNKKVAQRLKEKLNTIKGDPLKTGYCGLYSKAQGLTILDQCSGLINDFLNQKARTLIPPDILTVKEYTQFKVSMCYLYTNYRSGDLRLNALILRAHIEHRLLTLIVENEELGAEKTLHLIKAKLQIRDPNRVSNPSLLRIYSNEIQNLMAFYLKLKEEQLSYKDKQLDRNLDDIFSENIRRAKELCRLTLKSFDKSVDKSILTRYRIKMLGFFDSLGDTEIFIIKKIEEFTWRMYADINDPAKNEQRAKKASLR